MAVAVNSLARIDSQRMGASVLREPHLNNLWDKRDQSQSRTLRMTECRQSSALHHALIHPRSARLGSDRANTSAQAVIKAPRKQLASAMESAVLNTPDATVNSAEELP
jgi:hypothetical protein